MRQDNDSGNVGNLLLSGRHYICVLPKNAETPLISMNRNNMLRIIHPAMRLFILERRILFCKRDGAGGSGGVEACTADGECGWFTSCLSIELA